MSSSRERSQSRRTAVARSAAALVVAFLALSGCEPGPAAPRFDVPTRLHGDVAAPQTVTPMVSAGGSHTCALKSDGTVVCWGSNVQGQSAVPSGLTGVTQLSAGSFQTCALRFDGSVLCWFDPAPSGLANETFLNATDYTHDCVVNAGGVPFCWGDNSSGETTIPAGLAPVTEAVAGGGFTCALTVEGTVVCWGYDGNGQTDVPSGLSGVTQISAGQYDACARKTDGTVVCWGLNLYSEDTPPSGLSGVTQVSIFGLTTCALKSDGTVACWGFDFDGEANVPAGLTNVVQISAGAAHVCALKSDGTIVCWGADNFGQIDVPAGLNLIVQAAQTISFTSSPPNPATLGGSYSVSAVSTSGLPVTLSGLTPGTCSLSGSTVTFIAVGTCTIAADQAGNASFLPAPEATQSFGVLYAFAGFYAPVDNPDTVNVVQAGSAIPVKFSLGGDHGLLIFATNSPASGQVTCDASSIVSDLTATVTAGGSSLQYDAGTGTYTYVWKTDKAWSGTCRAFVVTLADGSAHHAFFQLR